MNDDEKKKPASFSGGGYKPLHELESAKSVKQEETSRERKERYHQERKEELRRTPADDARCAAQRNKVLEARRITQAKVDRMVTNWFFPRPTPPVNKAIVEYFDESELLYASAFQKVADKYNVIIGLRTPSDIGQMHLKSGHPSKNFHVKAKSSNTGPTAGFITQKALYSKVGLNGKEKHDENISKAVKAGSKIVSLKLSDIQIERLISLGEMTKVGMNEYTANYDGNIVSFVIKNGCVFDYDGAVQVLTNPPEKYKNNESCDLDSPITADYDLFDIICNNNQPNDRPLTIPPRSNAKGYLNRNNKYLKPKKRKDEDEDEDRGNVHFFGSVLIDSLNKEIKECGYKGGSLVWHNDESGNPFSPGFNDADMPIFFLPKGKPRRVNCIEGLHVLYDEFKAMGYAAKVSPRF
ncbi:anthrax toxin-like adenylyl cyclase domain-containing protein [uncultured Vibrio sp.]|uniref:anthrax toxin-like adenylyl cyclase domain-containing protein n=1 Tax=uncultured Vibrio sp. TaxID=114054 RepID=UPI00262F9603|nr:anthrax toxin-like adenylyl cyclase domain-containing protein [uncultured Vibrio sp.]